MSNQPTLSIKNILAPIPGPTRGQSVHIGKDPQNPNLIYCVGNSVVIRNYKELNKGELYQEHTHAPTVARFSPNGFYVCSADIQGKVRIWDTVNPEHILKNEYHVLSGAILDMAWNDKDRIAVSGHGKEKFGAIFFADGGSSVGEITGHSKPCTSIDLKPTRPFRIVTGSEDLSVNWFEGPPFKYKKSIKENQRLINCVRFSPNGEKFITVSGDKTAIIYDGKDAEKIITLDQTDGHKLGVYSASWSPDSTKILTSSADKTAKLWDAETGKCLGTCVLGKEIDDQQLGCLWVSENEILSISLNGFLNFLDLSNFSGPPVKIIRGHNKLITSLTYDSENQKLYSGDFGARMIQWDIKTGDTELFQGKEHGSQVTALAVSSGDLYSISMDDNLKISSINSQTWGDNIALDLQPLSLAVDTKGSFAIICGLTVVLVVKGGKIVSRTELKFQTSSVAISKDGSQVAIGSKDHKIYIHSVNGDNLTLSNTLTEHRGEITSIQYSPNGKYLVSSDSNREIIVWEDGKRVISGWVFHTARVASVSWSPNSKRIASVGTDGNMFVWNVEQPNVRAQFKKAHYGGGNVSVWIDDNTIATGGQDCAIKIWNVTD